MERRGGERRLYIHTRCTLTERDERKRRIKRRRDVSAVAACCYPLGNRGGSGRGSDRSSENTPAKMKKWKHRAPRAACTSCSGIAAPANDTPAMYLVSSYTRPPSSPILPPLLLHPPSPPAPSPCKPSPSLMACSPMLLARLPANSSAKDGWITTYPLVGPTKP